MKENKYLKIISYIMIPILILMIVITLGYGAAKEEFKEMDKDKYFQSDDFLYQYMGITSDYCSELIHNKDSFVSKMDGENKIFYIKGEDRNLKDYNILVLYKDKALTNVEFTLETDTIEEIRNYVQNKGDSKKVNIINGNVEADEANIKNKAVQYFNLFDNEYYTVNSQVDNEVVFEESSEADDYVDEVENAKKQRTKCGINDFIIYSAYKEEVKTIDQVVIVKDILNNFSFVENNECIIIPIASILVIVMALYIFIVIGHTDSKDEIHLNDMDKIPFEILCGVFCIIFCIIMMLLDYVVTTYESDTMFKLFISLIVTAYFSIYAICAIIGTTFIKRIKARVFWKNTLLYKFTKWCYNIIKKWYINTTENWELHKKVALFVCVYYILILLLPAMFGGLGEFLNLVLSIYMIYIIIQNLNCFNKIEKYLKRMYEGDNKEKLNPEEFTKIYKNKVKYINDISNGFENAVQDGIKSERMKTELITNVSHDIKTPLTSIINYVDLLKKEDLQNEKAKEYIEVLDNKSQRLKKLMEDLIEASKASSGNVKLNNEKINIVQLVKQADGEFEDKFKFKNLEIIKSFENEEIYINADNKYMYRIIENIFSNVAKYANDNSRVYIDIFKLNEEVVIEVKNISKEKLNISEEELMQRFVRGDKSRTTEGSGLGISIAKSLTEFQNGKFEISIDGDLFKVKISFKII